MKKLNIKVGDLVQVKNWSTIKAGIVKANDTARYMINNHFNVNNCIVRREDIVKIIKKQLIPKKYHKYL